MKKWLFLFLMSAGPAFASSGSGMGYFGTQIIHGLIHGILYGVIFKIFHSLGLVPSLIFAVVALGAVYLAYKKFSTN